MIEKGPGYQPEIPKPEVKKPKIKIGPLVYSLITLLGSYLPKFKAAKAEFPLKEVATAIVLGKAKSELERIENENLKKSSLKATREANKKFTFSFPKEPRFLVEKITIEGDYGYGYFPDLIDKMLKRNLENTFSGSSVVSLEKVRKEAEERRELRKEPEVKQETIPPSGTIERENVEVEGNFKLIRSRQELQAYLGAWGYRIDLAGFNFEKIKTLAVGEITFRDPKSQKENTLGVIGGSTAYTELDLGALLHQGIFIRERVSKEEQEIIDALNNALSNGMTVLSEKEKEKSKPVPPQAPPLKK